MEEKIRKVWSIFTTLIVMAAIVLAMLLVGLRFVGFQIYTVLSGSMEPAYQTGSLIYVREVDTDELRTGDVITFRLSGSVAKYTIAHRRTTAAPADVSR